LVKSQEGTSVKVTTIGNFLKNSGVPSVDFIKMDVEGLELKVLKAAAETIKTFKTRLALSAYHRGATLLYYPNFSRR